MFSVQTTIIAIVTGGIGVLLVSWFLTRQREETWQAWAQSHGFTYLGPPRGPLIIGSVNQWTVEVSTFSHGSDTEGGVEVVRMSVKFEGLKNHRAEGVRGVIGDLAKIGAEPIKTGDEAFDQDVMIQAESKSEVIKYWTTKRKKVFLDLVNDTNFDLIALEESELFIEFRSVIPDPDQLERAMNQMISAVEHLDVSSNSNESCEA